MVKVSDSLLPEFLTYPTREELHTGEISNVYTTVSNNSDTLLITIGDSWTYGLELDNRLEQVYGRLVSQALSADWLNVSCPGQGNFWITERFVEVTELIKQLDYKKIYVVCVFTEIGRSIVSHLDGFINYRRWFSHYKGTDIHNDFLHFVNTECINRINEYATDPRIVLRIGTTWQDPLGFTVEKNCFEKTWLDVIRQHVQIPVDHTCYSAMHGLVHLKRTEGFFPDKSEFMEWHNGAIDAGINRLDLMRNNPEYFRNHHTLAAGQKYWADYVVSCLRDI